MNIEFDTLVLSGGGIKGFNILGSLFYLHKMGYLHNIKKYIGTSVGYILIILLIFDYDPLEILTEFIKNRFIKRIKIFNFLQMINGKGLINFDIINGIVKELLDKKNIDSTMTLSELYDLKGFLIYGITFNFTKLREEIICHETFPNMTILEAIRLTSNIPIIFDKYLYNNNIYFDGFISNNFAINLVSPYDTVIGIKLFKIRSSKNDPSFFDILNDIFFWSLEKLQKNKKQYLLHNIIIEINNYDNIFNFDVNNTQMLDMFSDGNKEAERTFDKKIL
tara:strand:+ start:1528 stop:2361 length:834 start_codon:yes stop_codon:yes gene_type:complete